MDKDTKKKTTKKTSSKTSTTKKSTGAKNTKAVKKVNASKGSAAKKVDNKVVNKKVDEKKKFDRKNIIIEEPKEEVVKEVKKEEKKVKVKKNFEALDEYRIAIYAFIIGLLIGLLILVIVWPERIAELKDGTQPVAKYGKVTITADDLYEDMKDHYSVSMLLDKIDDGILSKMYPEDDEMEESIDETYKSYISYYEQSGYSEEQFLEGNGFSSKDDFLEVLKLDYRRNKYLEEYVESKITDEEIEEYYDEEVFGDIDTKHILVKVGDGEDDLKGEDAKKLAEEIISKLDDGMTFDEAKEEYKDQITFEELGYQAFNASLESAYMEEMQELENDEYSSEPVKTSYGYHIVYRIDQKDTPKLKDVKDTIIDIISSKKQAEDSNLLYKALISLREEKGLKFSDTNLEKKYNSYINSIEK